MAVRWDIFCCVVDNYGDIGVTWRLARQLALEYGLEVCLWVDEPGAFRRLCPQADVGAGPWRIAWVFFDDHDGPPVIQADRARLVQADAGDFVATMQMLAREAAGAAQPARPGRNCSGSRPMGKSSLESCGPQQ